MKTSLSLILIIAWNLSFSQVEFYPDFGLPSLYETALIKCTFDSEIEAINNNNAFNTKDEYPISRVSINNYMPFLKSPFY